jgi:hypothetical protein
MFTTTGTGVLTHEVGGFLPLLTVESARALTAAAYEATRLQGTVPVTVEYRGAHAGRTELLRVIPGRPWNEETSR